MAGAVSDPQVEDLDVDLDALSADHEVDSRRPPAFSRTATPPRVPRLAAVAVAVLVVVGAGWLVERKHFRSDAGVIASVAQSDRSASSRQGSSAMAPAAFPSRRIDPSAALAAADSALANAAMPAASVPAESASAALAVLPGTPVVGLVAERRDDASTWVVDQLNQAAAAQPPIAFETIRSDNWVASLQALQTQPRVAVVRYDALQAAHLLARRLPPLQIVAPLAADPVYFVVRADSPLHSLHDLADRAINVGPPQNARALTARSVYHQMFGTWPRGGDQTALNEDAALESLQSGSTSLDVVVVIGSSPLSPLRRFSPLSRHGLKLLALDATDPIDRKLISSFLAVPITDTALGLASDARITTPAVVAFLVTARVAGDDDKTHDATMSSLAGALCARLPRLGEKGRGAWKPVSPVLQVDVGWPYSKPAQKAFEDCGASVRTVVSPAPGAISR